MAAWGQRFGRESGFVPTMGFLHEGHMSLVRRARDANRWVSASIFVNPAQFNQQRDLAAYPRDLERDLAMLDGAGVDVVFVPEVGEMYRPGHQTWVEVETLSKPLEGAARPGHFRGVATVVLKLFMIARPARAYFGRKDAQQLLVITRMVQDLNVAVEVVACPTVREASGLAMSSRNSQLSEQERAAAAVLYRALENARAAWSAGESDPGALKAEIRRALAAEPLVELEYASVADAETLAELERAEAGALVSIAARVGPVRLIDNISLLHE
jgi:pantoate--beta-alanine ligase